MGWGHFRPTRINCVRRNMALDGLNTYGGVLGPFLFYVVMMKEEQPSINIVLWESPSYKKKNKTKQNKKTKPNEETWWSEHFMSLEYDVWPLHWWLLYMAHYYYQNLTIFWFLIKRGFRVSPVCLSPEGSLL